MPRRPDAAASKRMRLERVSPTSARAMVDLPEPTPDDARISPA
jgi:hypothetical protein